eukprot:gene31744-39212_t
MAPTLNCPALVVTSEDDEEVVLLESKLRRNDTYEQQGENICGRRRWDVSMDDIGEAQTQLANEGITSADPFDTVFNPLFGPGVSALSSMISFASNEICCKMFDYTANLARVMRVVRPGLDISQFYVEDEDTQEIKQVISGSEHHTPARRRNTLSEDSSGGDDMSSEHSS